VVAPRVTDAALVVGPAAWWHDWARTDYDRLAGAVAAGHVIECGPQATGGNYSFINEIHDRRQPGFPVAEIETDGSAVITKHPGTGGLVSVGTVTAQLLYEIAEPEYINPDVVSHFDTLSVEQETPDRVRISGTVGSPPPATLKVAMNYLGGYRNTMTIVITGLDIAEKAAWAEQELFTLLGGKDNFEAVDVQLIRFDQSNASSNDLATAHLRVTVKDHDATKVGRQFSNAVTQLTLASFAGFHTTTPPLSETSFGVYRPTVVPASLVKEAVVVPSGEEHMVHHPAPSSGRSQPQRPRRKALRAEATAIDGDRTITAPLGIVCGARSGDKGGNANVGLWTRYAPSYTWLRAMLTIEKFVELVPEASELEIHRFELPNLLALNFVVVGLLGQGVASSTRPDPQAKGLGEFIRSRYVEIPEQLVAHNETLGVHPKHQN
jgi:hypothetical protein